MTNLFHSILRIALEKINEKNYPAQYVGCVVLTHDKKILLQQRGGDWNMFPSYLAEFGGRIEKNETPEQAIIRELKEELGAKVNAKDLIYFGAITEYSHSELIHCYFWFDQHGTITGCYEGEAKYFDDVKSVIDQPKITDGLRWLLNECKARNLLS